ncbi:phenylalanine--tRNA ligase subunit alpha [Candidatus Woesearchaeota archaeon]|nr:phenylalanine--tRNA ligase subunit alpha [Candidatus Woesearchaeota archaeon]
MTIERLVQSLHPLERKTVPFLRSCNTLKQVMEKTGLPEASAMRALQWLENKQVLKIISEVKEVVRLDSNGEEYVKAGLPERRFLKVLEKKILPVQQIGKESGLTLDESTVCLGLLKRKSAIAIDGGVVTITEQGKKILSQTWLEESFLKRIGECAADPANLSPEEKFAFDIFSKRKNIIKTDVEKIKKFELTDLGKQLCETDISKTESVDRLTPEMLKDGSWKDKSFRRYDVNINVPKINRGKRHFVNQALEYTKRIWIDMGFKEMTGPMINSSFWNFDALFTAQDHPVRELQDTFYLKNPKFSKLPEGDIFNNVKQVHENGWTTGSTGWRYVWSPEDAKRNVLRTHTTVLSSRTLATLKEEDLPAKFFAVGKCFRNETLDYSHLFEFNQTEGIVIDPNANFQHLLGYLKSFAKKMGFDKVRFRPAYFPYTEPSVEGDVFDPVHNKWIEYIAAGVLRPEVVKPLLGKDVPVLAWGPGIDRMITSAFGIKDIRELYKNDLKQLRTIREWMK